MNPLAIALCAVSTLVTYLPAGKILNTQTIQLPAGNWDCSASTYASPSGAAIQALGITISPSASTMDGFPSLAWSGPNGAPGWQMTETLAPTRLAGGSTYYVNTQVWFTGGTMAVKTAYNCIKAL